MSRSGEAIAECFTVCPDEIRQAFATLLPVKTLGVMVDTRSYEYFCALRALNSTYVITAQSRVVPE